MKAPSFRCTGGPEGAIILHYYSDRPGLESIVIGIVKVSSFIMITLTDYVYSGGLFIVPFIPPPTFQSLLLLNHSSVAVFCVQLAQHLLEFFAQNSCP